MHAHAGSETTAIIVLDGDSMFVCRFESVDDLGLGEHDILELRACTMMGVACREAVVIIGEATCIATQVARKGGNISGVAGKADHSRTTCIPPFQFIYGECVRASMHCSIGNLTRFPQGPLHGISRNNHDNSPKLKSQNHSCFILYGEE